MKPKQKKQAIKKQPTESKELVKITIELDREMATKLKNVSGITGRAMREVVDQALRGLFGMPIPTIKDQIQESK